MKCLNSTFIWCTRFWEYNYTSCTGKEQRRRSGKKERQDETQFTTKIVGKSRLGSQLFRFVKYVDHSTFSGSVLHNYFVFKIHFGNLKKINLWNFGNNIGTFFDRFFRLQTSNIMRLYTTFFNCHFLRKWGDIYFTKLYDGEI